MLRTPFRRGCSAQRGAGRLLRLGGASVRGIVGVLALAIALALSVGVGAAATAGLPEGRVYEQVAAAKKNGNEAGVSLGTGAGKVLPFGGYANSSAGGAAVAYLQEGPAGETSSGADQFSVSRRDAQSGWETSAALPPEDVANGDYLGGLPKTLLPSADLSRFLFAAFGPLDKENNVSLRPLKDTENLGLY